MFQQTISGIVQGSQGRSFKQLVTSCPQSGACSFSCLSSSCILHSWVISGTFFSVSCLWWNDAVHNGLGFSMLIKVMSPRHTIGQQHVQSPSLRMASQMYLVLSSWNFIITKTINLEQAICWGNHLNILYNVSNLQVWKYLVSGTLKSSKASLNLCLYLERDTL